ncbi:tripartite tricarboxylate transporter substrate binding protein [Belnapia sp. T6]|uniref:Tripartite tricarboxylate transporter substrate binding protein n=1 Tax=Belnapia mucosa TaxID=2804532 RepID=A0ABS1VE30_9PROT|nr:tripartite tricarboxylate transporter substrate-binding protein [Belnapia mucosa]MBL6459396.1 tripartite tricarboxylate transporter substrate binding protein [Belnapia mucosa]
MARNFARVLLAATLALLAIPDARAAWPERPITLLVASPSGSPVDVVARLIGPGMAAAFGQPVVVQNVPGSAGVIGVERLTRSAPDGYTLGLSGDAAVVVRVSMEPPPPYDPRRDLAPISLLAAAPNLLFVANGVPARDVQELVALARARPGALSFAHTGPGTSQHIAGELLRQMASIDIVGVSYNNVGAQMQDVLAERVTMTFASAVTTLPRIRAGEGRALGVSSAERIAAAPEIPTVAEQGFPGFAAAAWFGLLAPAGTPLAVVDRVHRDAVAALRAPALQSRLQELGIQPVGGTPTEFSELIDREIPRMAAVLEGARLRAR